MINKKAGIFEVVWILLMTILLVGTIVWCVNLLLLSAYAVEITGRERCVPNQPFSVKVFHCFDLDNFNEVNPETDYLYRIDFRKNKIIDMRKR